MPPGFKFTLKAPKRITHDKRLKDVADLTRGFCDVAATLGDRLGALLFQLPPQFKKNLDVFDAFLDTLPPKVTAAFEFRHDSWLDESVYDRLRARNLALCLADTAERPAPHRRHRRLRLPAPARRGLSARRHRALGRGRQAARRAWRETFVYFKHEDEGKGPEFAAILLKELGIAAPEARRPAEGALF